MDSADDQPRPLSVVERPFPVLPFPAAWLVQFGGLSVPATRPLDVSALFPSAEPGQGPTNPEN